MPPIAYFITFSTYGCHLPGDANGWVHPARNIRGAPREIASPSLVEAITKNGFTPYLLASETQRSLVLESLLRTCQVRSWDAVAIHVRTNHVHCLLKASGPPEPIMTSLKAHATRRLKKYHELNHLAVPVKVWSLHGSTRYVWKVEEIETVTHYIYHEQGLPMARFCMNLDLTDSTRDTHGWKQ